MTPHPISLQFLPLSILSLVFLFKGKGMLYLIVLSSRVLMLRVDLTDFVFRTHMQDLKDVTQEVHYENYRAERLSRQGQGPPSPRKTIEAMYVNRFPQRVLHI